MLVDPTHGNGGKPDNSTAPGCAFASSASMYSKSDVNPVMVCPVVVQANAMGMLACSAFAAPARMPAALAPSGNDDAAKPVYDFGSVAPLRPFGNSA